MHWFPFYTSDFIGATLDLSVQEKSMYCWMLVLYFERRAPFPLDVNRLNRLIGCESLAEKHIVQHILNAYFLRNDDGWYSEKAEKIIVKQSQKSDMATYSINARWARNEVEKPNEINKTNDTDVLRTNYERNTDVILSRTRTRSTRTKSSSSTTAKPKTKQDQLPGQDLVHVLTDVITSLGVSGSNNAGVLKTENRNSKVHWCKQGNFDLEKSETPATTQISIAMPSEQLLPPSASAATRGKRLDPLWMLPKAWGEWAMQKFSGIAERDVVDEAEKFRDYWISIAGPRGVKLDWEATWRNWCRTGFAHGKREKNLSADEQKRRVIEEVLQRRAQADEREIES